MTPVLFHWAKELAVGILLAGALSILWTFLMWLFEGYEGIRVTKVRRTL